MIQFVWLLVVSYVILAVGLLHSLAIGSTTEFLAFGGLFVLFATLQRTLLSGGSRRRPRFGKTPRNS